MSAGAFESLSHARSAPPALKMMGITDAGEWAFTFTAAARVRAPKHTLSASTIHARHGACCVAVRTVGLPTAPALSWSGGNLTISSSEYTTTSKCRPLSSRKFYIVRCRTA